MLRKGVACGYSIASVLHVLLSSAIVFHIACLNVAA